MVKKSTGKTITEHVLTSISDETLKQSYLPQNEVTATPIIPKLKLSK